MMLGTSSASVNVNDVFSVDTYSGNGSTQSITTGVDLVNHEGMILFVMRNNGGNNRALFDTLRGRTKVLRPDTSGPSGDASLNTNSDLVSFNNDGFTVGTSYAVDLNNSSANHVAWTFRKQAKFFDVVTYTGNGASSRTVSHSLGTTPGMIWVKRTDGITHSWYCYHSAISPNKTLELESSTYPLVHNGAWNQTAATSTVFTVGSDAEVNANGQTYMAYLFAEDESFIKCGSYTGDGTNSHTINVGFQPQWILFKYAGTSSLASWFVFDTARGIVTANDGDLFIKLDDGSEESFGNFLNLTSTGFTLTSASGATNASGEPYVYMAIAAS